MSNLLARAESLFINVFGGLILLALIWIATSWEAILAQGIFHHILLALYLSLLIVLIWYRHKYQIKTGIINVDSSIKKGLGPNKALNKSNKNIRFLGIAADKLIKSPEFNAAISRCSNHGSPIRFLLSSPENPIIKTMAKRANVAEDSFKRMIINSLTELRRLRDELGYNIEVRLYHSENDSGPPCFRLYFIDEVSVLVSFYKFGVGDGSEMPQLHLAKAKDTVDEENFYYAFDHYFNCLWDGSDKCDFETILGE